MPAPVQRCDTCIYFLELDPTVGKGRCRRFPPVMTQESESLDKNDIHMRRWPVVYDDEWCGEWKPKNN